MNRIPRIFTHSLPLALTSCELPKGETAHYLLKASRVKAGQSIELFEAGQSVRAEVKTLERRSPTIQSCEGTMAGVTIVAQLKPHWRWR